MIYSAIVGLIFVLIMGVSQFHIWGTQLWWNGIFAGVLLGLVWHADKRAAKFLSLLGVLLLISVAFGFGSNVPDDATAFFNGMSLGLVAGFAISAWWRWDRFRPHLLNIARMENVAWMLRMLGEPPRKG